MKPRSSISAADLLRAFQALRIRDWWSYVIPPVMAIAYLGLLTSKVPLKTEHAWILLVLLLSSVAMASFGFLLNQWTDRAEDALAGKPNTTQGLHPAPVHTMLLLSASLALAPWLFQPWHPWLWVLLGLQLLSLLLYHIPPVRAKNHLVAAVLLDSSYSSLWYPLLAWSLFQPLFAPGLVLLISWCLARGLRNILLHLFNDAQSDARAGRTTLAHRLTPQSLQRLLLLLFLAETVLGVAWLHLVGAPDLLTAGYALWSAGALAYALQKKMSYASLEALNHGWELVLPYGAVLLLALASSQPWLLLHALLFPRPFAFAFRSLRTRFNSARAQP